MNKFRNLTFFILENRGLLRRLNDATFRLKNSLKSKPNNLLLQNIEKIFLISDLIKQESDKKKIMLEWKYLAMIVDRLFFYLFGIAFIIGTFYIFLDHPRVYDLREPIQ